MKKGSKHTEETRKKMSEAQRGRPSPMKGKHPTEKTRKKMSESLKGRILSDEHKIKLSEANSGEKNPMYGIHLIPWNKGKTLSDEHIHKLSESHKGKGIGRENPMYGIRVVPSAETRKKMSESNARYWLGKKRSEETKAKIRTKTIQQIKSGQLSSSSKSATMILDFLECTYSLPIEREYELEGRFFDGKVMNTLLIEVDSNYWHRSKKAQEVDKLKNKIALRNNFMLWRIRGIDDVEKAKEWIGKFNEIH